jgi:hypothetical protein
MKTSELNEGIDLGRRRLLGTATIGVEAIVNAAES